MRPFLVLAVLALAGCAMTESTLIDQGAFDNEVACSSDVGAYYLAKTVFKVKVDEIDHGKGEVDYELAELKPDHIPDRNRGYCLDFLASRTAKEKIHVNRDNNLLKTISTETIDQSAYILKNLAAAIFKTIPSTRSVRAGEKPPKRTVFRGDYDPFDPVDSARTNARLASLGFCVILENFTFDTSAQSVASYCNNPLSALKLGSDARWQDPVPVNSGITVRGIFYRPRVPYSVYLFVRDEKSTRRDKGWRLAGVRSVALENRSPILSVGIERSFFAARRAALVFHEGALGNVCIAKTSELLEFSTVPLAIAKGIVSLPTQIVQFRIEQADNHTALVQAENSLIKTQMEHLALLQKVKDGELPAAPAAQEGPKGETTGSAQGNIIGEKNAELTAEKLNQFVALGQNDFTPITVCPAAFNSISDGDTAVLQQVKEITSAPPVVAKPITTQPAAAATPTPAAGGGS